MYGEFSGDVINNRMVMNIPELEGSNFFRCVIKKLRQQERASKKELEALRLQCAFCLFSRCSIYGHGCNISHAVVGGRWCSNGNVNAWY